MPGDQRGGLAMYAVVVRIKLDAARAEEAIAMLNEAVVPASKGAPGFQSGTWMRSDDASLGLSVELFDSEANARAFVAGARTPPGSPATIDTIEVLEVMASA